ncbi:uncharacterized protein SRS1_02685 [Sporisorium reilianum f. sp. reilianum]|uniref:Uncharacterized protein n=1 Tax=Sporisorium reilianum f. sp. reilianum TaxID=72559 RepID=A0A2N8U8F3_9BASI|nr:uncharacterized protein SRS1_02685 [Sporisorium reilianum f. sp. reilianum]
MSTLSCSKNSSLDPCSPCSMPGRHVDSARGSTWTSAGDVESCCDEHGGRERPVVTKVYSSMWCRSCKLNAEQSLPIATMQDATIDSSNLRRVQIGLTRRFDTNTQDVALPLSASLPLALSRCESTLGPSTILYLDVRRRRKSVQTNVFRRVKERA